MLFDFLMWHFHGYYWDYLLHLPVPIWVKRKVKFQFNALCTPNAQRGGLYQYRAEHSLY